MFINEPILHRNGICLLFDFLQKCSVKRDGIVSRIENQRDFVIVEINRIDQYRNERLLESDLSRVLFTKTFAVIYEFIFFNFLIKDRQTSVNLNFHVIKENLKRSKLKLV